MKAEKQHREFSSCVVQLKKRKRLGFIDNRLGVIVQTKLINNIKCLNLLKHINPLCSVFQRTIKETPPQNADCGYQTRGTTAKISEIQNINTSNLKGSVPSVKPDGWDIVLSRAKKVKGSWVRFHLVNHNIGGQGGDTRNLVPTEHSINHSSVWNHFEEAAKDSYNSGNWVWCKVSVVEYHPGEFNAFPKKIKGECEEFNNQTNTWDSIATVSSLTTSYPNFGTGVKTRTLDEMTTSTWRLLLSNTGIGPSSGIVSLLNGLSSQYSDINDFWEAVIESNEYSTLSKTQQNKLETEIGKAIRGVHTDVNLAIDY